MPCDYQGLPHEGIRSLKPYIPGKSANELAKEQGLTDIIKLASNENPLGCSPMVVNALNKLTSQDISIYPIASNDPLQKKLSHKLGITSDMLTLANGSDTFITLLQTCFALHLEKHIITHDYAFITYSICAKALNIPIVTTPLLSNWHLDIDSLIAACNEKTALIFLATPNNPTGVLVPQSDIERLLQNIPKTTLLVLDEAYYEFVPKTVQLNTIPLLTTYPNLVILRTFSKIYGLAGLRLGYAIASADITNILQRVLMPFAVNEAALIAGSVALDDDEFIQLSLQNNAQGLQQVHLGLTQLGLGCLPTAGNFITFDCKTNTMPLYQNLLEQGIILRPLHNYGLDNYLRATIGTQEQNNRFLETLKRCIHALGITSI